MKRWVRVTWDNLNMYKGGRLIHRRGTWVGSSWVNKKWQRKSKITLMEVAKKDISSKGVTIYFG